MSAHPTDCFCPRCVQRIRGHADAAQAQTLRLFDDLYRIRRRMRALRAVVVAETERLTSLIDAHIGRSNAKTNVQTVPSPTDEVGGSGRRSRWKPRRSRKGNRP